VFVLEGETGNALVNSLEREIKERSSEWRALPDLPDNSEDIATALLSATQKDGESADNLRKADVLSMRRAKFAIKLRDFEAYERDLLPYDWQKHRHAFFEAFIQHVLVLPTFFNLAIYLPRIIRLATACEDFVELRKMIEKLFALVSDVRENCESKIKSCDGKNPLEPEEVISTWLSQLYQLIDENIKMAFPPRLSRLGHKLWDDQFGGKDYIWPFETDINELKKQQYHLFSHDLAYMPFRFIGIPNELHSHRGIPAKKTVVFLDASTLLCNKIYSGLQMVGKSIKCFREKALPYGLLFATRPFNLTELYLLSKDPYSCTHSEDIAKSIFALRGFCPEKKLPLKNDKNILEVSLNREKTTLRIGLASWKTDSNSWIASVTKNNDSDLTRYKRLTNLLNEVLKSNKNPDYLIFPELSIPARWFLRFAQKLQRKGISLVAGVEYLHRPKKVVNNQVWVALSHDGLGFPSMIVFRQDKLNAALYEEQELYRLAGVKLKPYHPWKTPPIIRHGDFFFALLVCSELTNISYRSALCGKVDALFVPEWNKDTETFNALVESAALDIHVYIIQCNDRQYGDSRIRAPYKESWKRDLVRLKGGITDYFVIGEIDIMSLRKFQSSYRSPDGIFKPVPDGFNIKLAHERKVLPQGNNHE
jgi:predicted amidohydrolase